MLYTDNDIEQSMERIETVDFHAVSHLITLYVYLVRRSFGRSSKLKTFPVSAHAHRVKVIWPKEIVLIKFLSKTGSDVVFVTELL